MKFVAVVCVVVFALLGVAFGLKDPVCGLPAGVDGNGLIKCAAYIPKHTYHADTNSCQSFIFGGCGGNANSFESLEACEAKCKE